MHLPHDAMLPRIFIGETDRWKRQPLYEAIVLKARELHLAGATVLRGPMGFGKSSRLHTAKILRLSMDLPLVIEIVDTEEKIQGFLPVLDEMMKGGLVTLERPPRTFVAPCALEPDGEGARPVPGRSGSFSPICCGRGPAAVRFRGRVKAIDYRADPDLPAPPEI
jgi:hypothetical protein